MPKQRLSLAERYNLLEETKQKLRLEQEARTIARIEQLDIEACVRLGKQLQLQHTARQYTLYLSDSENDLTSEQNHSSTVGTVNLVKPGSLLETPD